MQAELEGELRIGALTNVEALVIDPVIAPNYPGVLAAAGGLGRPQIWRVATLGGNIAQRNRCWYFRIPVIACLKKGGDGCSEREGIALDAVAFDSVPSVALHPSTLAVALMAYDASLDTNQRRNPPLDDLLDEALGDGRRL